MKLKKKKKFVQFPLQVEKRKTFSLCCLFCCCQSDPLFIIGKIPAAGYTSGETIPLEIEINNKSDERLVVITAAILKVLLF